MENVAGVLLESYMYPDFAINPSLYQSNYWVSFDFGIFYFRNIYEFLNFLAGISFTNKEKPVLLESATIENEKARIDFEINLKYQKLQYFYNFTKPKGKHIN